MVTLRLELPPLEPVATAAAPLPPVTRTVEPIGWLYECMLAHGKAEPVASPTKSAPAGATIKLSGNEKGKAVRLDDGDTAIDWYGEVLGLPDDGVSEEEIRAAHKKRVIETHPDKQPGHSDLMFKKVQRALDILCNPDARRAYDSSRPFDDTVPGDGVKEEGFFAAYSAVFDRNGRFSTVKPVPVLGDDDTEIAAVKKFYDFWLKFRSWRDFSCAAKLERISEEMARDEKRHFQRKNQTIVDKLKRDEMKRVRTFVEKAMKLDPRLRRHREAEEAVKLQAKKAKDEQKAAAEAETRRLKAIPKGGAPAAAAAGDDKGKTVADLKVEKRTTMKKVSEFLRAAGLMDSVPTNLLPPGKVRQPNVTWMTQNASLEEINGCLAAVSAAATEPISEDLGVPAVLEFNHFVQCVEQRLGRNRYGESGSRDGRDPTVMPPALVLPTA